MTKPNETLVAVRLQLVRTLIGLLCALIIAKLRQAVADTPIYVAQGPTQLPRKTVPTQGVVRMPQDIQSHADETGGPLLQTSKLDCLQLLR